LAGGAAGHRWIADGAGAWEKRQMDLLLALATSLCANWSTRVGWPLAKNSWVTAAGLGLSQGSRAAGWSAAWPLDFISTAALAPRGGRYHDAALHQGGRLILSLLPGASQVKVDPKKPELALVDGAPASPSP